MRIQKIVFYNKLDQVNDMKKTETVVTNTYPTSGTHRETHTPTLIHNEVHSLNFWMNPTKNIYVPVQ